MTILSLGRRRLSINIRVERVAAGAGSDGLQVLLARQAREAALAERNRWEVDHLMRTGRIQ